MTSRNISFNRLAIKDYREARTWYAERSPIAAANFVGAIDEAVQRIIEDHDSLPIVSSKYRRVRVKKFPYILVFYARTEHDTRIIAVAHTSRRPGYWRRRQ